MANAPLADPGLLELVGELADVLGLAERIQRFLPTQRLRVQRKHKRIEKLLDSFSAALNDARVAIRVLASTADKYFGQVGESPEKIKGADDEQLPRIGIAIPTDEISIYRRGVDRLQVAIRSMTTTSFDLEAATSGVNEEVQRYYKISQAGNSVLRLIRHVLEDHPESVPKLLSEAEAYLTRCARAIEERNRWIDQ